MPGDVVPTEAEDVAAGRINAALQQRGNGFRTDKRHLPRHPLERQFHLSRDLRRIFTRLNRLLEYRYFTLAHTPPVPLDFACQFSCQTHSNLRANVKAGQSPIPVRFKAPIDGIADGREKDILIHVCDYMNDLATGHVRQMTLMVYT